MANTKQNDKFKFQTVANTRQMVPAKKSKKKSQTCSKKNLKLFHTHFLVPCLGLGDVGEGSVHDIYGISQVDPLVGPSSLYTDLPTATRQDWKTRLGWPQSGRAAASLQLNGNKRSLGWPQPNPAPQHAKQRDKQSFVTWAPPRLVPKPGLADML